MREAVGEGFKKFVDASAHLGPVARGKVGAEHGEGGEELGVGDLGVGFPGEFVINAEADTDFVPAVALPLDEVEWQGIEQFIAEGDAGKWIGSQLVGSGNQTGTGLERLKRRTLFRLKPWKGFGDHVLKCGKRLRAELGQRGEDIARQRTIVGTGLDDPPPRGRADLPPFAQKPMCKNFPKQWPYADAGEKIALAPDLVRLAGVVPECGVVERHFHEIGEAHRPV